MNAQPSAIRRRYMRTLDTLMPEAAGRERDLRCSILIMRDRASSALRHCGPSAYPVLSVVAAQAAEHVFTPMPLDALESLRYQLVRLTTCASGLETFDRLVTGEDVVGNG